MLVEPLYEFAGDLGVLVLYGVGEEGREQIRGRLFSEGMVAQERLVGYAAYLALFRAGPCEGVDAIAWIERAGQRMLDSGGMGVDLRISRGRWAHIVSPLREDAMAMRRYQFASRVNRLLASNVAVADCCGRRMLQASSTVGVEFCGQ